MEQNDVPQKPIKDKSPLLKWNGDFNFGNLLTILIIVIAAIGLYYQKRSVETKIDDLQIVVAKLEEEKLNRELQGLKGEEQMLNSFSYNLGYTVDQLRATGQITDFEFMFLLTEFNELIDLALKRTDLAPIERQKMEILKERNQNKREVFAHSDIYRRKISEFEEKNKPPKKNYKTIDDYNTAQSIYIDTLQKHIKYVQHLLDSFLTEPIKNVKLAELRYFELQPKN
jgi:hypothetical protein